MNDNPLCHQRYKQLLRNIDNGTDRCAFIRAMFTGPCINGNIQSLKKDYRERMGADAFHKVLYNQDRLEMEQECLLAIQNNKSRTRAILSKNMMGTAPRWNKKI